MLVALEHTEALLVVVVAAVEMVIVAGGVVERRELVGVHTVDSIGRELAAQSVEIVGIG